MVTSGIGAIKNIDNNRIFAFKSINLEELWEIYKNQLNLNIHHNKRLQRDWNSLGGEKFEFYIIEEIDDEFILDDEFVDFVGRLDNNYNDFNISSFFFEYSGETTLIALYEIIGREKCNPEFLDKLKSNDLSIDAYYEIKNEMVSLINNDFINKNEIADKLNELIQEKSHQIRVFNLDTQYKLMNDLEDIIGIYKLNEDFISKLKDNNLPELAGFTIQENIMELIFSNNVLENNIEKQIDSSIELLKEKISKELIEKLLVKANNLEKDDEFLNKLENSNLSIKDAFKIINQLKEFINVGIVTEDNFSLKLNELVEIEIENQWLKTKQDLLIYLSDIINSDDFKNRLISNYLDISLLPKFNQIISNSIESKEITSTEDVDNAIERIIDDEIKIINNLKEELLSYLANTYGSMELSSSFKTILSNSQLSIDDGKEFIAKLSYDISSYKIKSIEEIKYSLDELIIDKNKRILYDAFYNLVGKEKNNDSFSKKIKFNYLTEDDGNKIRNELFNLINETEKLNDLLELRNTLEYRLDEMVQNKGQSNYNKLTDLSNELIKSLNDIIGAKQINDLFKEKLFSHNLGEEYWDLIKNEIIQLIDGEFNEPDFELKMNHLNSLKNKGISIIIDEIIQREYAIRCEEYKLLKSQLMSQLDDLIGLKENTPYFEELLLENHLSNHASLNIRNDFNQIIASDEIYDVENFNYKYEELVFVKNKTIKTLLLDLVQKQKDIHKKQLKDIRLDLITELNSIIGEDSVIDTFKKRLYSNQLSLEYAETFKKSMENLINSNEIFDKQFKFKLDELFDLKENGVDLKLSELIDKESQVKLMELNNLKKELLFKLDNLTKGNDFKEKLRSNNLNSKVGNNIKKEVYTLINSPNIIDSKFNYKLEELNYLNKKSISVELDELIQKYSIIYKENISNVRRTLHEYLDSIIGKDVINKKFKEKLHENLLSESFADEIKVQMTNFIDSDKIFNKKYEFKLDELSETTFTDMELMINEIIEFNRALKEEELIEIRENLNNDLITIIGESNNDYYNNLLKSHNLNSITGLNIREYLFNLINSDIIKDNTYEFKLDELKGLKELGIDKILSHIVDVKANEYNEKINDIRIILIDDLNQICNSKSFKEKLHLNKLHYSYKSTFNNEMKKLIYSDQPNNEKFEVKLDELLYLKDKSIEVHLDELIKREANIKNKELIDIKEELNNSLNELIGYNENNEYYNDLLKSHNLNYKTDNAIRLELYNLINSENVFDNKFEFKLDELIVLKEKGLKNHLIDIVEREESIYNKNLKLTREKLLNSLKLIISENSFKDMLHSKQIDDSFIDEINKNISDFIYSDFPYDDHFEVKLDELLFVEKNGIIVNLINELVDSEAKLKQNELSELRTDLKNELFSIIGKNEYTIKFSYKLINHNLNDKTREKIRFEMIDLISSNECQDSNFNYKLAELRYLKEYGIENKIDDIIKRESEIYNNSLKEKRENLIDITNSVIGKNKINSSFIHKLKSYDLEENFANKIRNEIIEFINTDQVYNKDFKVKLDELNDLENKGIESKIDEIIENELHQRTLILKEKQLKTLHNITGDIPLSNDFLSKLNNADFDDKFGIEIINHFESEIDSLNIEEDFDFNKAIDDMIYDKSTDILLKQTYEIIGKKSDSEYFKNKLKNSMISTEMGENIKTELFSMIENADLEELTKLRKISMQTKFDEIISREHNARTIELSELREKLLKDLNKQVSRGSFKKELRLKNLSIDYLDKIKNEIKNFIKSEEVEGDFEFKVDELSDLNEKGITSKINEIIERESHNVNLRFNVIKNSLLTDLDKYISFNTPFNFAKSELNKRDLTQSTGKLAYNELKDLITSDKIKNSNFTSKYEELDDLKSITVKNKFIEIIDEYSTKQQNLIKFLHENTIGSSSFNRKINAKNLADDFIDDVVKNIEIKIKDNEYTKESEITQAISHYVNKEAVEQDRALTKLYDIVGKNGISLKFRAKLRFKGLSSDNGKKIVQIVENKIKTEGLRAYSVPMEIDNQIEKLLREKQKVVISHQKYVFCTQCGHKNINGSNFCEQCGERLSKL